LISLFLYSDIFTVRKDTVFFTNGVFFVFLLD